MPRSYITTALTVLAIIGPTKPTFLLRDATVYAFNLTEPNSTLLNATFRVTLSSRNPNRGAGIEYYPLGVYATYRDQQITMFGDLVRAHLGPEKVTVWAPVLLWEDGWPVPVSPATARAVRHDLRAGVVAMNITVTGRMRWKVGSSWRSEKYYVYVVCPAYLRSSNGKGGGGGGSGATGVKYQLDQPCGVELYT